MNSETTKRIIRQIAKEEGLSDSTIRKIVLSQYEGTRKIMSSGTPDEPNTFKNVILNAFGSFTVKKSRFKRFKGRQVYLDEQIKRRNDKQRK